MAKRKSSRRARSRKPSASRRQAAASSTAVDSGARASAQQAAARQSSARRDERRGRRGGASGEGSRPQAPWHPLPLSELLILVGLIGVAVWWIEGPENNSALIGASVAAIAIGTFEFTLREHLGGFRSHTVLLAVIPVVVFHAAAILVASAFTTLPKWVNLPLLAIDLMMFALLFKLLRLRYLDARRERRFAGGR